MREGDNGSRQSIDFRPEMGSPFRAFGPGDLRKHGIKYICPEFIAKTWGPEAANEYRRQSATPTTKRDRLIDIA